MNELNEETKKEIVKLVQSMQQGDKKSARIIQNIMQRASQGDKEALPLANAIQELLKQKAAHGTKLQYFKSLKHKCADDEEVYYYKAGGSVGCGCRKIEKGESGMETPENRRKKTVTTTPNKTTSTNKPKVSKPVQKKQTPKKTDNSEHLTSGWTRKDDEAYSKELQNKIVGPATIKYRKLPKEQKDSINSTIDKCGGKLKKHKFGGNILELFH